jgi:hypothetical protein
MDPFLAASLVDGLSILIVLDLMVIAATLGRRVGYRRAQPSAS